MPTYTSNEIISHLTKVAPHRSTSTIVNNIVMEQQKSRRKKILQFNCANLSRNEVARKRLQRKLAEKRAAKLKK